MPEQQSSTYQDYLLTKQYNNSRNLKARIEIHERFSTNKYDWQRWVFDHFHVPATANVLELGCGPGELWVRNRDRIPDDWHITLSDFSPGMVQEAEQRLRNSEHTFTFKQIDAQAIPFADNHFDTVIANHMLYHVPDRGKTLSEIRRVLKQGGRFYAATNGETHMAELKKLVGEFSSADIARWDSFTISSFRRENGREELSRCFNSVELHIYENGLLITEADPLVAYVLSTPVGMGFDEEKTARFTAFVQQRIDEQDAIAVTKSTVLFEAY
jgi:ubiquinone/menaquinone biosynthesis C-methylase UbiE